MKILIAPDKFKGSLTADQVCAAISKGLSQIIPLAQIKLHPMADGGDGSLSVIAKYLDLKEQSCVTLDPLQRPLMATYFSSSDTAFIELASASGLSCLKEAEKNPLETSSLGSGYMIEDALSKGFRNIYLFLGGSATNDAGIGIASALGFQFSDINNKELEPVGKNLEKIEKIESHSTIDFKQTNFTLLCDVQNPFCGLEGAAHVYAAQKGANPEEVKLLDKGLEHFAEVLEKWKGVDVRKIQGGGAAGGIGGGLVALLDAKVINGFEAIAELTQFESQVEAADLVISGEGKLDTQSLEGKVIDGVAQLCKKYDKPLYLVVGKNELSESTLEEMGCQRVLSIMDNAQDEKEAMRDAAQWIEKMVRENLRPLNPGALPFQ